MHVEVEVCIQANLYVLGVNFTADSELKVTSICISMQNLLTMYGCMNIVL